LNNTIESGNLTIVKINLKAMIMGILLLVTTFLVDNNMYGTAFAQTGNNEKVCAYTLLVTISHLPNQTAIAGNEVALIGSIEDSHGEADIKIPSIGTGIVTVLLEVEDESAFGVATLDILGHKGHAEILPISETDFCSSGNPDSVLLSYI
jgi:hypothetical protein